MTSLSKDQASFVARMRSTCERHGIELVEKPNGHFQLKGRAYLVNYYPFAKVPKVYVASTTAGMPADLRLAVNIADGRIRTFKGLPKAERKGNPKNRRKRMWERGVRSCHWCKEPLASVEESSLEHIIPLSRGGLDNPNNWALAHKACNNARGNLLPHKPLRQKAAAL